MSNPARAPLSILLAKNAQKSVFELYLGMMDFTLSLMAKLIGDTMTGATMTGATTDRRAAMTTVDATRRAARRLRIGAGAPAEASAGRHLERRKRHQRTTASPKSSGTGSSGLMPT